MSSGGARRGRLRERLRASSLDALLVTAPANVRYLCGFTGSAGELLVTADGAGDRFVTDGRYVEQAAGEVGDLPVEATPGEGWLARALGGRRRLGLEAAAVSWQQARRVRDALAGVEVVPSAGHVEALREVKDPGEVAALRRACAIGDEAFAGLCQRLAAGMTERDAAVTLERLMVDLGADGVAFPTIVASGPNGARPHHRPGGRVLAVGDLVTCDFGATVEGYHSDMTRTVAVGGRPPALAEVYAVVRRAQQAGLDAVAAGVETGAVDAACRRVVAAAGLGERFVHGTGHGVGLDVHEAPFLRPAPGTGPPAVTPGPSVTLRAGTTITVEPGVYLPGAGGVRIEDCVLVSPGGAEVLTRTPKDLRVLQTSAEDSWSPRTT